MKHFIIPDTQVKPDVPINHLEAAGNYIIEKQPDVIVHLGDHWQGCIMKHEVEAGNYCLMEVSLNYLLRNWL